MLGLSLFLLLLSNWANSMLLGWVNSPGYPSGYLPNSNLNWSRCAHKGHTLSIRFIHMDVEDSKDCENDAVKVFSNGNLISVLCGKKEFEELRSDVNPLLVSSSGGCLSLDFHSDYSNIRRHTGFRAFYTEQDFDECEQDPDNKCTQFCHNVIGGYHCSCRHGYHLDTDKHTCTVSCSEDLSGLHKGTISSPSWPGSYAENANCQYTLSVEAHLQLELRFSEDFDVEEGTDGQCIDALRIETPSGTLGSFCGHTPPPSPFLTHSHHVKIHFTSDGFGTNKGFNFHFKTRDKVCPAKIASNSTVTPQKPEYHRGQSVTVICDLGYVVNTQGMQTAQYKTTCHSSGIWTPINSCEPVDCGFPELPEDSILQMVGSHTQYKDQIQFKCSSNYYTLEGDDTYTCSDSGDWVSGSGMKEMPKCTPVCGMPDIDPPSAGRILGGENAKLGEIPWGLLIKGQKKGGASLINDRWAVTAAHVVENVPDSSLTLYGGMVDGKTTRAPNDNVVVMKSERIIIHPGYMTVTSERINFDNDIALIRLASRVTLGPNLLPICLPEVGSSLAENVQGTVSGWGLTEWSNTMVQSQMLKYAHIGVKSLSECENTAFSPSIKHMIFTNNMFCAGAPEKDSCRYDSGGPFFVPMLSAGIKPYVLRGIVSWGPPCDERKYIGYYVKVANYVDWIKETIDKVETS